MTRFFVSQAGRQKKACLVFYDHPFNFGISFPFHQKVVAYRT